jgi:hypothetical protein
MRFWVWGIKSIYKLHYIQHLLFFSFILERNIMRKTTIVLFVIVLVFLGSGQTLNAKPASNLFITIQDYGGTLCRLVNLGRRDHGVRCARDGGGGLKGLDNGETDFSVITKEEYENSPFKKDIRALFSLPDSNIVVGFVGTDEHLVYLVSKAIIEERARLALLKKRIIPRIIL